jgi:hypothetical protein
MKQAAARRPRAPASLSEEIQALKDVATRDLQDRFAVVHGYESRSNNRDYLWKRIAWKLQELAEGGLSDEDRALATALARGSELRTRPPRGVVEAAVAAVAVHPLDPRLPPPGSVLRKEHGGEVHEVIVLDEGFEYRGATFKSLSRVAREITGAAWNGFLWFGLTPRCRKKES